MTLVFLRRFAYAAVCTLAVSSAYAGDAVQALNSFVKDVKSGRTQFTQVVLSPDGKKKRVSYGSFEFQRPNRFRFDYAKPYEQVIVGDGQKVWLYDVDLNQVTVRPLNKALGASPAALLAGAALENDFFLKPAASSEGLDWVEAQPKIKDGQFQMVRVGFKPSGDIAVMEIIDSFGQRSRLDFKGYMPNAAVAAERFQFKPPAGADVADQ